MFGGDASLDVIVGSRDVFLLLEICAEVVMAYT